VVERHTPAETVQGFLAAARAGNYALAAHYLWLNHISLRLQPTEGARLARRLRFVIDRPLFIDYNKLPDDDGDGTRKRFQLGVLPLSHGTQPIRLVKVDLAPDEIAWVFDEDTVRAIDRLYERHGPPFAEKLHEVFFNHSFLSLELWQWLGLLIVILGAALAAIILKSVIFAIARRAGRLKDLRWYNAVLDSARGPLRLTLWAGFVAAGVDWLLLPPAADHFFEIVVRSAVIIAVAWFLRRFVNRSASYVQELAALEGQDPGRIRGLRTQLTVLNRVFEIAIYVVSVALLLMQFDFVRHVGVSLLASAGIAGLVIGFAAQRSMSTILAGIQLSFTQPIRIGDTVVVENENGVIEEITLTYAVVRTWDLRRLIVPITYFLEKPFQNWSKGSPETLGAVTLAVDHLADIDAFRAELQRILEQEERPLWDGKVQDLKVTEVTGTTITLRILLSSSNPEANWNLRCLVRERMLRLLQKHPQWLPTSRAETRTGNSSPDAARPQSTESEVKRI